MALRVENPATLCGAIKRNGKPCQLQKLAGASNCRLHGGKAQLANMGNKKTVSPKALYSAYLDPDDLMRFDEIEIGSVDSEIKLMRLRLEKALRMEAEQAEVDAQAREAASATIFEPTFNALDVDTVVSREGGGPMTVTREIHRKRRDYGEIIRETMRRIESLERTRAELHRAPEADENPVPMSFTFEIINGRKE